MYVSQFEGTTEIRESALENLAEFWRVSYPR
jgi:hypothetical protein